MANELDEAVKAAENQQAEEATADEYVVVRDPDTGRVTEETTQ